MKCIKCHHPKTRAINTCMEDIQRGYARPLPRGVVRRTRECRECHTRFKTYEFTESQPTLDLLEYYQQQQHELNLKNMQQNPHDEPTEPSPPTIDPTTKLPPINKSRIMSGTGEASRALQAAPDDDDPLA